MSKNQNNRAAIQRQSFAMCDSPRALATSRHNCYALSMNYPLLRCALVLAVSAISLSAAEETGKPGYKDTPLIPGTKWHIHDSDRPQPKVVSPAKQIGQPPSDAIVLFDGKDLSHWQSRNGKPAPWKVEEGAVVCLPKTGDIVTKEEFGDIQLHIEFATPTPPHGNSQERGNSGVFLMDRFEFQVLDSYNNPTYADGGAAAMYGQHPPLANASRPPGEWQAYDIVFTAPHFKDGKLEQPAYITAFHNGVLVQNHQAYFGPTNHRSIGKYTAVEKGPIHLQDHGNTTKYRNIWIRRLPAEEQ